ncbi:hypothetical protein MLD38_026141 [Melastoma candidum]|uniref:Uncharacterized protein n=1 Tax=Melastoma candidum TaxID=119954 RepID=A0ACB9NXK0_9MYRT|nr:hypothetical protein MLD38_026141 [Melastoma candidum]
MPEKKNLPSKRKRREPPNHQAPPATKDPNYEPYPDHALPTPEDCLVVRDRLLALHGFPQQFAKYRDRRVAPQEGGEPPHWEDESVLDGLVKTVISQNTTEVNSDKAFACLKSTFPSWEDVLAAETKTLENAIRCGGLAPTKAACIKNVLRCLMDKRGELCLEYLRELSVSDIKAELSNFKGIGPKTVACVLLFNLQQDDFPVDTHVFEIAKTIGWVPMAADRLKTYLHLNRRIPKELKFDLNCLIYTHGKLCNRCNKGRDQQKGNKSGDSDCPLLCYSKSM